MDTQTLKHLLEAVQSGYLSIDEAMDKLKSFPYDDMGFAKLDSHRCLRTGSPEVVYCPGKTADQVADICKRLSEDCSCVLATRAEPGVFEHVKKKVADAEYFETARIIRVGKPSVSEEEQAKLKNYVLVLCAGTADLPVAEEATIVARTYGSRVETSYDVGVAGLHRLLDQKELLFGANAIVVVAGMEGALASVVGGLVSRPVIAVPTSVGYGASFGGVAALLSMLNSCAVGVSVVNIDNGFGAGSLAHIINTTNSQETS